MRLGTKRFAGNRSTRSDLYSGKENVMYIQNGIAYAGELTPSIEVSDAKVIGDLMLLLTFNTGEQRIFDAVSLLEYPAFQPLKDSKVFRDLQIEYGVVTWKNGEIDIAPETMYKESFAYDKKIV